MSVSFWKRSHADKATRRHFLTAGAMGLGGLTLAGLLRAESAQGIGSSRRAIINIHLDGGPPQMDTIDMKPLAPAEVRGEFNPIATNLPGFQICELMPKLATIANRFAFVRSLVGSTGRHDAFQCQSGFAVNDLAAFGGRPAMGCVVSKLRGASTDIAPAFVDLMQGRPLARDSARPGFLGPTYKPFRPDISQMFDRPLEDGMKKELAALGSDHATSLAMHGALNADRLSSRQALLDGLDRVARNLDASGEMNAVDTFHQQATNILTSGRFAKAIDLSNVSQHERSRYTAPVSRVDRFVTADSHLAMQKFLLARRLIEAGVRIVSVSFSDFDTHTANFKRMRHMLPILDFGLHALIMDLEERGMLDEVVIIAWGEFGRTPKINNQGGRDHWPQVGPAFLAGGGLKVGQVIGSTDRTAAAATSRPISYKDVFATLYHTIGIHPHRVTLDDPSGRPQYLLDEGKTIREVV